MATASKSNGTTAPDTADIAAQIEALKGDLAELTNTVSGYARDKGQTARDAATAKAEQLGNEAVRTAEQAGDMVRERPAAALGLAAAVGFVVGYLSTRR